MRIAKEVWICVTFWLLLVRHLSILVTRAGHQWEELDELEDKGMAEPLYLQDKIGVAECLYLQDKKNECQTVSEAFPVDQVNILNQENMHERQQSQGKERN